MNELLIKYCGNKSLEDLRVTANSDADFLGFIFAESKRRIQAFELRKWLQEVDIGEKQLVGVFVNAPLNDIIDTIEQVPLQVIQCHGTETVEFVSTIKATTQKSVWKVIHHSEDGLAEMKKFSGIVDGFVIDSKVKGMWGGSGQRFDWSFIPQYTKEANNQCVPCFIAGGLNKFNIEELLTFNLSGIDVSSGIERDNVKNEEIITIIEKQVKHYESSTRSKR